MGEVPERRLDRVIQEFCVPSTVISRRWGVPTWLTEVAGLVGDVVAADQVS